MPDDRTRAEQARDMAAAIEHAAGQLRFAAQQQEAFAAGLRQRADELQREDEAAAAAVMAEVGALLAPARRPPGAPAVPTLTLNGWTLECDPSSVVLRVGPMRRVLPVVIRTEPYIDPHIVGPIRRRDRPPRE